MNINVPAGNYTLQLDENTFLTNTANIYLQCQTGSGAVNIILPRITSIAGITTTWGFKIYINDVVNNAATNNITITPHPADKINGTLSIPIVLNTNGVTGHLQITGTNSWEFNTASSGGSGASGYSGFSGLNGIASASGYSGFSGKSGYSGFSGLSGYSGFSGLSGYSGFSGATGAGTSGFSGYSGFSGLSGYSGFSGLSGYSGFSGVSGYSGFSGRSGYSGFSGGGTSGFSGFSGATGGNGGIPLLSVIVDLSAAQIQNLATTPVLAVAASGAGTVIAVFFSNVNFTAGGTPFNNDLLQLITDTADPTASQFKTATILSGVSSFTSFLQEDGTNGTQFIANKALMIQANLDSVGVGDGTARVYIIYRIQTI